MDIEEPKQKYISRIYHIVLAIKGIDAFIETIIGGVLYFIARKSITSIVLLITKKELLEDPTDFFANHLVNSAERLTVGSKHYAGIYLMVHGAIKLMLIVALFRKKQWAYPVSIVVFILFIVYELYSYTITSSLWMVALVILDVIVVALTINEYRTIKITVKK